MELELSVIVLLIMAAFIAGFIDSIAGGGGMITIPALFYAGIPPTQALGTNKLQSSFGSGSAMLYFYRKGHIDFKKASLGIIFVFILSALGSLTVQKIDQQYLAKIIPFLLIIFAFYFLFSPKVSQENTKAKVGRYTLATLLGLIGFYDGFFGPGTGSFFLLILVALGGSMITSALAYSKLFNFTSNIASLLFFAINGQVLWLVGLLMAIGQFTGATLGAKVALRYGGKIIKPLVVVIALIVAINLLYKQYIAQ
ncbi:hypothetical protein CCZ01_04955 [Helicobacter monodelphidis]|uniref:TSUP family transporter n=1 Tax=Helicobacter sp. 15-1451 TaxID=2004995 RepID=UPI000DCE3AFD|nr:TSUP family transporter [Helicobacter sp. 15-1451]RAX57799.1 hypothetical protein CCZ01_04955 [Helicobacter sp. 15-1451]